MFFIFGFGKRTVKLLGETNTIHCTNCSNVRKWNCKKITIWFTLFFIPVFPYRVDYIIECPICHGVMRTDKNGIEEYIDGDSEETRNNSNLTEVQRNYLEEMRRIKEETHK